MAFPDILPCDYTSAAGFPNGFSVTLHCPNDRYLNDEAICQAAVGMLGQIGMKVNLVSQSKSLHFPVLILPSALALDLLFQKIQDRGKWFQAVAGGVVFVAVLIAVNWPFANFLMSPASRNWVFGTQQFAYFLNPTVASVRNVFFAWEQTTTHFLVNMGWALVAGIVSTRVGITLGGWLQRVQR